jgi:hypothetical protein
MLLHFNTITLAEQTFPMLKALTGRIGILIIVLFIAFTSRLILIRFMNRWMMSKSSKIDDHRLEHSKQEELEHLESLKFKNFNTDIDIGELSKQRLALVVKAKKKMLHHYLADIAIIMVYLLCGFIVEMEVTFELYYFWYVIFYFIWATIGFIGFRHQFTSYKNNIFDFIVPIWKLIFAIFKSKWKFFIAFILVIVALLYGVISFAIGDLKSGILMTIAISFHLFVLYYLRKKAKLQPNLTLLILRVFLINKTSLFTFSRLANFWKHYGSYITVADPSFFKIYWKRNFKYSFPIFMIIILVVYTQLEKVEENSSLMTFVLFTLLLFIGAIIYISWNIVSMKRNFVRNQSSLSKELLRLKKKPVKLDGTFKETPLSCYDNTWQITVETLVKTSNVVLMDLRGFSEKNKGCEYEINLLLNKIHLSRILFIGYTKNLPLIKETIAYNFKTLTADSPNINLRKPVATIFEVRLENNKETQYIMDILLNKSMVKAEDLN